MANAPVREALIDLRFEPPVSLDVVDRFIAKLGGRYGARTDLWEAVFGLVNDGNAASTHSGQKAVGRRVQSVDVPQYILQARAAGFTLSRLSPYGKWGELRDEAWMLWEAFRQEAGHLDVTRVAVRYINELNLPLPLRDFGDYLTSPPHVPAELPQSVSGFLSRVIIPDLAADCVSIVTQVLDGDPVTAASGATIMVLLDIEVYRTVRLNGDEAGEIFSALDTLRDQKNRMFFEHLTEKTVEMYE
ncbi:TIGR04255 family protein [Burkholderia cepacia]|uniref:TIGR04255 family protein n=1 Tax=Burkholderia cepacia TaxID=292 RepID=UPI0018C6C115|nr:TIGR04255 family protein [Burkholderia cepacia]